MFRAGHWQSPTWTVVPLTTSVRSMTRRGIAARETPSLKIDISTGPRQTTAKRRPDRCGQRYKTSELQDPLKAKAN